MESAADGVIDKAFKALRAFTVPGEQLTLSQLIAETGLPRSTAHRLLVQLERVGALERTQVGWRIGVGMFELGQLVASQRDLRERALPYMHDLQTATRGTIHLAILDGADILYVEVISGRRRFTCPSRRGGRVPAHCTALGKVLIAFGDRAAPELPGELPARTPRTIVDPDGFADAVDRTRRTGIAYDNEEAQVGLRCIAGPVFGARPRVAAAALSVSLPADDDLASARIAPALRVATGALSRELAHLT